MVEVKELLDERRGFMPTEIGCAGNCKQETKIALLQQTTASISEDTKAILKVLQGDNGEGLSTRVAVGRTRIRQIAAWVGVITAGIGIIAWGAIAHINK